MGDLLGLFIWLIMIVKISYFTLSNIESRFYIDQSGTLNFFFFFWGEGGGSQKSDVRRF